MHMSDREAAPQICSGSVHLTQHISKSAHLHINEAAHEQSSACAGVKRYLRAAADLRFSTSTDQRVSEAAHERSSA